MAYNKSWYKDETGEALIFHIIAIAAYLWESNASILD